MIMTDNFVVQQTQQTILELALQATQSDRQRDYGRPLINFLRTAIMLSVYLQTTINPIQVAYIVEILKIARQVNTDKRDNHVDVLGYAITVSDMDKHVTELGYDGTRWLNQVTMEDMVMLLRRLEGLK